MKKHNYTKYLMAALLMAGAAFVSCTKDEEPLPVVGQTYTMTVNATKGGDNASKDSGSKQLTPADHSITATWAEGEAVTVYNVTKGAALSGTLTAQSSGASTTLKGSLTGTIENGDVLKLKFLSPSYSAQDGTLTGTASSIDKVCDYAEASVTVTNAATSSVTTTDADFHNKQAIVKFTLKDIATGNPAINATKLTVTAGETTITVTPSSASSELYVAIPSISGQAVDLSANVGYYIYTYNRAGVTFDNSQYYEITVMMTKHAVNLAAVTSNFTAANGDVLTGTLGSNVQISIANGATITLENARLAPSSHPGLTCLGNATINLVGENTTNGGTFYAGVLIGGEETTLTINGPGSLSATGGLQSSGIGLSRSWSAGTVKGGSIVINGGTITARGNPSQWGAGIGTGVSYSSTVSIKNITINGGDVTAIGGANGCAGIGTSYTYTSASSAVGNITINGGSVTATGTNDAAAIGTGHTADGCSASVGNITISGGTVTATCSSSCPTVIGCVTNGTCGDIELTTAPTFTLNNPNNSGSSVSLRSFVDTDENIIFPMATMNPGSIIMLDVGFWVNYFDDVKFGCPETAQEFIYMPKN